MPAERGDAASPPTASCACGDRDAKQRNWAAEQAETARLFAEAAREAEEEDE